MKLVISFSVASMFFSSAALRLESVEICCDKSKISGRMFNSSQVLEGVLDPPFVSTSTAGSSSCGVRV
jgi:hypothetical protein